MSDEKEVVLARVRAALRGAAPPDAAGWVFRRGLDLSREEIIELFIERAADYRADVTRVAPPALRDAITGTLSRRGIARLALPADLPAGWVPEGVELLRDVDGALSHAELDASDGVLTGCAHAIAETGTIVLDGGAGQGRRALTLLPDYHLCVVPVDRIVGSVPEAIGLLGPTVREHGRSVTFISGPSATSDIELNRVEGVHGPRRLDVLVVG